MGGCNRILTPCVILACVMTGPAPAVSRAQIAQTQPSGDPPKPSPDARYRGVFWGKLELENGRTPVLVDVHTIMGSTLISLDPRRGGPQFGTPKRLTIIAPEADDPTYAPGSLDFPLRFVAGRRYIVFEGNTRHVSYYKENAQEEWNWISTVRVIDLDETLLEAQTRVIWRQASQRHLLRPIQRDQIVAAAFAKWVENAQQNVAAGIVTVGDVLDALGEPNRVTQIGEGKDFVKTEGVYPLAIGKLLERKVDIGNTRTINASFPVLVVEAQGAKVTKLEKRVKRAIHRPPLQVDF